jgi:argininosuccinate synthase
VKVGSIQEALRVYHLYSGGVDTQAIKKMKDKEEAPSACVSVSISQEAKRLYQLAQSCETRSEE